MKYLRILSKIGIIILMTVFFSLPLGTAGASDSPLITINQLNLILDNPEVIIIDVRTSKAWRDSPVKIKGAVRGGAQAIRILVPQLSQGKGFSTLLSVTQRGHQCQFGTQIKIPGLPACFRA